MGFPAELAVPVEVRLLDVGARLERVFRLSSSVDLDGISFERALPFEAGRPVRVRLTLPDDREAIAATGVVRLERAVRAEDDEASGPRTLTVAFTDLDPEVRERILRYLEERTEPQ